MGKAAKFQPPDLEEVMDRAASQWGWKASQQKNAETWYERFLELVYDNPGGAVYLIDNDADKLWHEHITFTVRYRAYCQSVLGFFLEHTPIFPPPKPTKKQLAAAMAMYTKKGWKPKRVSMVPCH
jgi:hypothetical protein